MSKKTFSIESIYKSAWKLFKARPWTFVGYVVAGGVVQGLGSLLLEQFQPGLMYVVIALATTIVNIIIAVGLVRVILMEAYGKKSTWNDFRSSRRTFLVFLGSAILAGLGVVLGLVLLIIPGLILALTWMYVNQVAVQYPQIRTIQVLQASAEITKGARWKLLGFSILNALVAISGIIALGVGILITIPIAAIAGSLAYKELHKQTDLGDLEIGRPAIH